MPENYEIGMVPAKMADVKHYVRMYEGQPQLIRIEPFYNDNEVLIPLCVMMFIDNEPGVMVDRMVSDMMVESYTPLENLTQWQKWVA